MPDLTSELGSMPFNTLVGSPLVAAVDAQSHASLASAQFILNTAFETDPASGAATNQLKMVTMTIDKWDPDSLTSKKVQIKVPLLTLMNVPNIRIEEYNYDFLVKINSIDYKDTQSKFAISAGLDFRARWGWGGASLKVATSYQKETKEGTKVTRDYQMNIKIKAVSDQLPGGTQIILDTLQKAILEEPVTP